MPNDYIKRILTGDSHGRGILISTNSDPGTLITTVDSGTSDALLQEVFLWADNSHTSDIVLTIKRGSATMAPITIPFRKGLFLVLPGIPLRNGLEIRAFAETTDLIRVYGYVNEVVRV
jgi:hypothetical protein